jgi:hypothetical protein
MTKILALQFFAAALVFACVGAAATVAISVDPSPALHVNAAAPGSQLIASAPSAVKGLYRLRKGAAEGSSRSPSGS